MMPQRRFAGSVAGWRSRIPSGALAAAIAHGLRMLVNLVVIKLIAVAIGPVGLGAIGNLISVLTFVMVFAGGGVANGVTKYVAQHRGQPRIMLRFIESALALGISVSGVVFLVSLFAAEPIAQALFGTPTLWWLAPIFGFAHFSCFLGTTTIAIANGNQRSDIFAAISIFAYVGCIPVAYLLIEQFGFAGSAMALMAMAGCTGIPALWVALRSSLLRSVKLRFHGAELRLLLRFSGMAFASAVTFPLAEILIRTALTSQLGLADTGIWQASIRLSGAILGFYTVFLATSYMPRLSAITDTRASLSFVYSSLLRTGGAFAILAFAVYFSRSLIVPLLFSAEFRPLEPLLAWQLLGDFFRVSAYVIGFLVIARARLSLHIGAEIVQYTIYAGISLAIIHSGGDLSAVVQGYAASYAIYLIVGIVWLQTWGQNLK